MAERFFRALLRLYPREFRNRYGPEQEEFFSAGVGGVVLQTRGGKGSGLLVEDRIGCCGGGHQSPDPVAHGQEP